ncbi:MAG: YdcF family protein [Rhodospirillales bacterium]|nr:YdcF family protein [Rhodospirillales bacterium]
MAFSGFKRRRRPTPLILGLGVAAIAALLAWTAGLFLFTAMSPEKVEDNTTVTDAIVVLTGGSGRMETGLALLEKEKARRLFVSGVYRGVDVARLLELSERAPRELRCCVELGHSAGDTAGNAQETAAWMKVQGFTSLRIVTASYHMPRSLLEFRAALPETTLIPHPVFPEHVKRKRWWAWPGTSSLFIGEYSKYLVAWTRIQFSRMFGLRTKEST